MHGGWEQQIPPQAAVITFGFPSRSKVPTTQTGVVGTMVSAPKDFFIGNLLNILSFEHYSVFNAETFMLTTVLAASFTSSSVMFAILIASFNVDSLMMYSSG